MIVPTSNGTSHTRSVSLGTRPSASCRPWGCGLAVWTAPLVAATYREIEARIGPEFSARFYATLDELIGLLGGAPPAPD